MCLLSSSLLQYINALCLYIELYSLQCVLGKLKLQMKIGAVLGKPQAVCEEGSITRPLTLSGGPLPSCGQPTCSATTGPAPRRPATTSPRFQHGFRVRKETKVTVQMNRTNLGRV